MKLRVRRTCAVHGCELRGVHRSGLCRAHVILAAREIPEEMAAYQRATDRWLRDRSPFNDDTRKAAWTALIEALDELLRERASRRAEASSR